MQLGLGQALAATPDDHSGGRHVSRDLFPLPRVVCEKVENPSLSRCCQRMIQRRSRKQEECNRTSHALNHFGKFCEEAGKQGWDSNGPTSAAQVRSLEFIEECIDSLGPPGDVDGPGALEALRVTEGYEDLPSSSTLGSFDPALVSLPAGEVQPRDLAELWGEGGQNEVKGFIAEQLVSPNEALQRIEALGPQRVYSDPKLRVKKDYVAFLKHLIKIGLVDLSLEAAVETVCIFFVRKKQNKLRLILDCRRSNHHFRPPTSVNLTTGESLRRVSIERGESLYVCSADLQDAFYTLSMPHELRKYFGLQRVRARDLGVKEVGGVAVAGDTWIQPRVSVLPMGWSWALYWCQVIHERAAERSGLTSEERLQDFKAAPTGKFWHIQ